MGAYDTDLHAWAMEQTVLSRAGRVGEFDLDRCASWSLTIREQRRRLQFPLEDNPSLPARFDMWVAQAYGLGCLSALRDTGLERQTLRPRCPWTEAQLLDDGILPE